MPIRHCQKCGLKVLIDESQTAANPFYCQRCAVASSAPEPAPAPPVTEPPPLDEAPTVRPEAAAPPPPPPPAGARGGPVKVLCPYCKASFSGRLPSKPAKGACPVCQKELVLLPDGKIRPAANFDLAKWQKEQELLKYGGDPNVAEQARAVQRALEGGDGGGEVAAPEPIPEPAVATPDPLAEATVPSTSDYPPPAPEPVADVTMIPMPRGGDALGGLVSETMLDMARPPDLDETARAAAAVPPLPPDVPAAVGSSSGGGVDVGPQADAFGQPSEGISIRPQESVPVPSSEEPTVARASPPYTPAGAMPSGGAEPAATALAAEGAPRPGLMKVFVCLMLFLLPLVGGFVIFKLEKNDDVDRLLSRVHGISVKGFLELEGRLGVPPYTPPVPKTEPVKEPTPKEEPKPEPPKPEPPKEETPPPPPPPPLPKEEPKVEIPPPPKEAPKAAEERQAAENQLRGLHADIQKIQKNIAWLSGLSNPTEVDRDLLKKQQELLENRRKRYARLQEEYARKYGAPFDPGTK